MKDLAMLNDRICDAKGIDKMVIIEEIKEEKKVEEPKEEEEPKNKKKDVKKYLVFKLLHWLKEWSIPI